jgi:hypothetical protein
MLVAPAAPRRPGIRFEVPVRQPSDTLPRMDVAVLVGFAASGPIHTPVPVEDVAQFRAVFGGDLRLAWDRGRTDWVYAHLGAAVRDFFRNGGRRCWVVRVAGPAAKANVFTIPGLMTVSPGGSLAPAYGVARSEGSWSDAVRVATALLREPLALESVSLAGLEFRAAGLSPGDLLHLTFPGRPEELYCFVGKVEGMRAHGVRGYWVLPALSPGFVIQESLTPLPAVTPVAARLTFELWARLGDQQVLRLTNLGFSAPHPRYWGTLPRDADRFRDPSAAAVPQEPLFPIAGLSPAVTLPLGMGALPDPFAGPLPAAEDPLVRDSLDTFDAGLFLDPKLRGTGHLDLLAEADFVRYQSPRPRTLQGIHAALGIEDATLIAVPDAVHWGWRPRPKQPAPAAPPLPPLPAPAFDKFLDCATQTLEKPSNLQASAPDPGGSFTLTWSAPQGDFFRLEEATRPDFSDAFPAYEGPSRSLTLYGKAPGEYFYRVQARSGKNRSDWSDPIGVRVGADSGYERLDAYSPDTLLEVQRCLLRMCAARGDLFALLALPETAREEETGRHVARLLQPSEFGFGDAATHSYGALYHPWLVSRDEDALGVFRRTPPDGAAMGILARRAHQRGAWIAPANEPLRGVTSLAPSLPEPGPLPAGVNWILQQPRGFLLLSADTLSGDEDLRLINVRRLIMLLRRVALQRGMTLVFEPNDDAFRRLVQSEFDDLLRDLFRRGAFAGRTPASSYQVVAGPSLNTAQSIDQGRFLVELRVAPSQPLKFLTVRLMQSGDRGLFVEAR